MYKEIWDNKWTIQHIRNGQVIWEETKENTLTNEGARNILNTYLCNTEAPSQFYIRLANGYISVTDTLASIIGEPVGNGYSPQLVERSPVGFPYIELDNNEYRRVSKTVSFTSTNVIGPVNYLFLATTSDNSGVLVAGLSLSSERVLQNGDVLQVVFKVKIR